MDARKTLRAFSLLLFRKNKEITAKNPSPSI